MDKHKFIRSWSINDDEKKLNNVDEVIVNGEDLSKYRKLSAKVFNLLQDFVKEFQCPVERLGLDENFIDVSRL